MKELVFSWTEDSQPKTYTISSNLPKKVYMGRDPNRCDIVLPSITEVDLSVSKLHVEIYFTPTDNTFYLRNLKGKNNPPQVYGKQVDDNPVALDRNGTIQLGRREIQVRVIEAKAIKTPVVGLRCPHCDRQYTYEEGQQLNGRCRIDGYLLQGSSIYISKES